MDLLKLWRIGRFFGLGPPLDSSTSMQHQESHQPRPIKIGLIGASKVATYAVIWPSRLLPGRCQVVGVAARDPKVAIDYSRTHGIKRAYGSYQELIDDPEIDVVYVGLPNGLHGKWTKEAVRAKKHVLCEKPFAANSEEATDVWKSKAKQRSIVMSEAFHYRHHPLFQRLCDSVSPSNGQLGTIQRIDVNLLIPQWCFPLTDIRFDDVLAGGAMTDAGAYCAHISRWLAASSLGCSPTFPQFEMRVDSAAAKLVPSSATIDGAMIANWEAKLKSRQLGGGGAVVRGRLHASLRHTGLFPRSEVTVYGSNGSLQCRGFVTPFFGHIIEKDIKGKRRGAETAYGSNESTYLYQLDNFLTEIELGQRKDSDLDSIMNMRLIDDCYKAAGLSPRQPTSQA
jgi:predicted dehydrogenase